VPDSAGNARQEQISPKILIVEDEHLIAFEMESTLVDAGFAIAGIAVSAGEAISLARSTKPDLVIMDIRLAGVRDGVDAALELFREDGIRCVFASAHQDHNTRSRAEPARPLGWLAKPYQPDALVRAVRTALALLDEE
jgi:DNA-binding NarL/FixJ family response regulator